MYWINQFQSFLVIRDHSGVSRRTTQPHHYRGRSAGGPYPPQSSLKDLSELAERGLIVKVHGDARSVHSTNNPTFDTKFSTNRTAKEALARVAAEFIHDGASLAFSAVTTCAAITAQASKHQNLTVITNSTRAPERSQPCRAFQNPRN